jgi:hypothetical protein
VGGSLVATRRIGKDNVLDEGQDKYELTWQESLTAKLNAQSAVWFHEVWLKIDDLRAR